MSKIILFLDVSMCFKSDWVFQGCISGYFYFPSCSTMGRIVGLIVSFENIIE